MDKPLGHCPNALPGPGCSPASQGCLSAPASPCCHPRHPEQTPCPGSPELCRETPVTLAGMTLALVSFSRPEHTSLLPPSTAQVLPWAPASDMAPEERKRRVAQQPAQGRDTGKESPTGRRGIPVFTCEGGHQHRLPIAGAQDGCDDVVHEALCDAHLQQGLGHRALRHVDKGITPQRTQQLLQAGEGIAVRLVLVDPGGDRSTGCLVMPRCWGRPPVVPPAP